jgi:TfoX/Sxy family transcriptional regulator of competence genes
MAYDETLADRVRNLLASDPGYGERKMFGGLCFMLDGHMTCGIVGDSLMLRLNEQLATEALRKPHVRPMDFTGRPMRNMVYVDPPALRGRALRTWIEKAATNARSLPAKSS